MVTSTSGRHRRYIRHLRWLAKLWRNRQKDGFQVVLLAMGTRPDPWDPFELAFEAGIFSWKIWAIRDDLVEKGLIEPSMANERTTYRLTPTGWERYRIGP
jgi:predicted transcriptional regulator